MSGNICSRENELYAKQKKCQFARDRFEHLGHLISRKGVEADLEKLRAMLDWPTPTTVREVWGFLGLTGYYRRFVQNYGSLACPFESLVKERNV